MRMELDPRKYSADRGLAFLGLLMLALVVVHYVMDIQCLMHPRCMLPAPPVTRFACLCPIAAILVSLAMILGNRALATYGIVLFVMFPLGATIDQYFTRGFKFEWPLAYQLVLLVAAPACLFASLFRWKHVPMAVAASLVAFFVKGMANFATCPPGMTPELQIWLFNWLGPETVRHHFLAINLVGLGISVLFGVGGWFVLRKFR